VLNELKSNDRSYFLITKQHIRSNRYMECVA